MTKHRKMVLRFAAYGLLIYVLLLTLAHWASWASGWKLTFVAVLALFASPIGFGLIVLRYENTVRYRGRIKTVFNPAVQSWAFLADIFALTPAMVIAAHGWSKAPAFANHLWWYGVVSPLAGLAGAAFFHFFMDAPEYRKKNPLALSSPSKVWHNRITYPVLFSATAAVAFPYLWTFGDGWHVWAIIACYLVWLAGGLRDGVHGLDPKVLHVPWDKRKNQVATL